MHQGGGPSRLSADGEERDNHLVADRIVNPFVGEEAAALYKSLGAKAELGETYMRVSRSADVRGDARTAQKFADLAYKATKRKSALVER